MRFDVIVAARAVTWLQLRRPQRCGRPKAPPHLIRPRQIIFDHTEVSVMPLPNPTADAISRFPFPKAFSLRPDAVAKWIDTVAPCVTKPQSREVTDTVIKHLRDSKVPDSVIAEAISKSTYKFTVSPADQYAFAYALGIKELAQTLTRPVKPPSAPSMSARQPMTLDDVKRQAAYIDSRYEAARAAGNTADMVALANMLWQLLKAYLQMRQDKDKLDQVREEILGSARNIAPIIRRVEREGPAPGPDGRTPRRVGLHEYILEDAEDAKEGEAERDAE